MRKFLCPVCCEVAVGPSGEAACKACGERMIAIDGLLLAVVPNRPGGLAEFLGKLAEKKINVTTLRVVGRCGTDARVLFSTDQDDAALQVPGVQRATAAQALPDLAVLE
jgi:prephenate dehydratase